MLRPSGWWALTGSLLVQFLFGQRAHADRIAIAPLRVTSARQPGSALREQFRVSIAGGMAASGHDVVPDEAVAAIVKRSAELGACDTDVCYRKLGELAAADAVVRGAVEVLGSSSYQLRLEVYDVGDRGLLTYVEDACTVCTVREANEALSRAAAEAGRRFTARVHPSPPPSVASAAVPPLQQAAPRWTPRAKGLLGGGITLVVLGAGGVASGAALVAIDGRTSNDGVVGTTAMERVLHTQLAGILAISFGAALVAGGSLLIWGGKRTHDHSHR